MTVKRPSKHQTEDRSKVAFGRALPSEWVLRDKTHDYGIDQEVEIFTEESESTGIVFLVQLKGTKSKNKRTQKSVPLRLDTLEYYKQLELPVLIARWTEETDEVYVKWAHEIDPYKSIKKKSKTTNIIFSNDSKWTEETPQKLLADIKRHRQARAPGLTLPIKLILNISGEVVQGMQPYEIRKSIQKLAVSTNFVVVDAPHSAEDVVSNVKIDQKEIEVRFADAWGCTIHGVERMYDAAHEIPLTVFLALAVALDRCGHTYEAAKIINHFISDAPKNSVLIPYLISVLLKNGDIEIALDFVSAIPDDFFSPHIALVVHLVGLASIKKITSPEVHKKFYEFLKRIISRCEDEATYILGSAHYNLGNYLINRRQFSWAVHHYRAAAQHETDYTKRIYFNRELAGIFFMGGRHRQAVKFYQRAIDLGGEDLHALLADALMFSGQYQAALDHFIKHNGDDNSNLTAEFFLKEKLLTKIIKLRGHKSQNRRPYEAKNLALVDESLTNADNIAKLEKILLEFDVLSGLVNFNLGVLYGKEGHHEKAAISFLIEAFNITTDVEAWRNAFLECFNAGESYLLFAQWTAMTAHFFCKERFVTELISFRDHTQNPEVFDQLINAVDSMLSTYSSSKEEKDKPVIRNYLGITSENS